MSDVKEASMKLARLFAFLPVICSPLVAAPRTFVSALNGSDVNVCSRALPCRSFAAAIPHTDVAGEVVALDSGGYGPITMPYAMSIVAPGGIYAGITAFSGNAITISSTIGFILLKNLSLTSLGADLGIAVNNVRSLYVEGCTISGFSEGIFFNPTDSDARLYVKNSVIRRSGIGIYLLPSSSEATVDSVRFYGNDSGVEVTNGEVTVRRSVASGPGTYGFRGESNGKLNIEDSASNGNVYGFYANAGAIIFMNRCQAVSNTNAGVNAQFSPSAIYVSDSTIAANATGIAATNGGAVFSRCTDVAMACPAGHFSNTLQMNTTNGAFTGSYTSN